MSIVHHHLLYYADTNACPDKRALEKMLTQLVEEVDMQELIEPRVALSHQNAYTGLIGIVTSHISFHYWVDEAYVQMDIYSCKEFDREKAVAYMNSFWNTENEKTLFIDRDKEFKIYEK